MTVGLAILGIVNAITIDNHLITTKNGLFFYIDIETVVNDNSSLF